MVNKSSLIYLILEKIADFIDKQVFPKMWQSVSKYQEAKDENSNIRSGMK